MGTVPTFYSVKIIPPFVRLLKQKVGNVPIKKTMPRQARDVAAGYIYHVLNRGNRKQTVFHKEKDYVVFIELMKKAKEKFPIKIFAYCLMPNHYHFALMPLQIDHLSKWIHWLTTVHASRYHFHYQTCGHIWQGRYKNILIQDDYHLSTVLKYIERNPIRAGFTNSAYDWPWSSYTENLGEKSNCLLDERPDNLQVSWDKFVDSPIKTTELENLRKCIKKRLPYGDEKWKHEISTQLGIRCFEKQRGRPRKIGTVPN